MAASPVPAAEKGIALKAKGKQCESAGGRRIALVVGNSAWRHSGALANPARDAELMARVLREVGFELHGGGAQTDLSRIALDRAIESFGDSLKAGDVALF